MMKRYISILVIMLSALLTNSAFAGELGDWNYYLSYSNLQDVVETSSKVFFLSDGNLYSVNKNDTSVETYDKTKTLNDNVITHIAWCQAAKRLVIVYDNQNIDLMEENGGIVNMPDYYNKVMTGSKNVNGININGKHAYLSTAFGIVNINVAQAEVTDTYNLGFGVNWVHVDSERIYAESKTNGQYSALLSSNLLYKGNWTRTGNYKAEDRSISEEHRQMAEEYKPLGPDFSDFYQLVFHNGKLYTTSGLYIRGGAEKSCYSTAQVYNGQDWQIYDNDLEEKTGHKVRNISYIAIDPANDNHVFVGGSSGLYEFIDGHFIEHYDGGNSPIKHYNNNQTYAIIGGVEFDSEGNLWVLNMDQLLEFTKDHEWKTIASDFTAYKALNHMFMDSRGILWFGNHRYGDYILAGYNTKTGEMRKITTFFQEDGVDVTGIFQAVSEDRHGNLWVGLVNGIYYLPAENAAKSGNDTFEQVKVPRNDGTNLADYLLANIPISAVKVDAANRKWIGTYGLGLYVISDDCYTQEANYTVENSPILSNTIYDIAFDEATGEVYISTEKGLCSFKSDVTGTNEELESSNVYAYPNPVTPDYNGPITVVGLTYNADVKIVSTSGQLVAEGRSTGGSFTWYGTDLEGRRVASGVYMVLASTEDGKKGAVCKIAIVR